MNPLSAYSDDKRQFENGRILFVDDTDKIGEANRLGLGGHEFEVAASSCAIAALRFILPEKFDGQISDLHMPDMGDGPTFVTAMRHALPKAQGHAAVFLRVQPRERGRRKRAVREQNAYWLQVQSLRGKQLLGQERKSN
jgi:CheY-like chemotaxis protein